MVNENGKYENLPDEVINNSCRNLYFNSSDEKIKANYKIHKKYLHIF